MEQFVISKEKIYKFILQVILAVYSMLFDNIFWHQKKHFFTFYTLSYVSVSSLMILIVICRNDK